MKNIAVFASGEGTNLQSLIDSAQSGRINGNIALVVSSRRDAGALKRAEKAGIPAVCLTPADYSSPEDLDKRLTQLCSEKHIDLICLAGFMLKLGNQMLSRFPHIMNIHPALLPSFGGKGMYGMKVHEAALASGARLSGATVHFIDKDYDTGPIILQAGVPVLEGDTPETLAKRVHAQEHLLYPRAVSLFCEDRLKLENRRVKITAHGGKRQNAVKRALISVSDKTGLAEFAKSLSALGVEIVSTSGTAKMLKEAGINVRPLESMTGFPEILSGRVKTLHPMVHGAILFRRQDSRQRTEAERFGLEPIDLVAVNLYPFAKTAANAASPFEQKVIEEIDIGGVALLRAAAKNFEDVAVISNPAEYKNVIKEMESSGGCLSGETRKKLAVEAFGHTAEYDTMIHNAFSKSSNNGVFPKTFQPALIKIQDLRYGENPHQKAALYSDSGSPSFSQLHGKELSFNNILDANGTWEAVCELEKPAVVIFKHVTPCGIAEGENLLDAFNRAWNCDGLSAFGGVIAVNRKFTKEIAEILAKRFVEVISAPEYDPEAVKILSQKQNIRLLERKTPIGNKWILRSTGDETLVTERDSIVLGKEWNAVTKRKPSKEEEQALKFAWTVCKHVKSNAIVLADRHNTVGIGAGQMSRVDSVHMAGRKYQAYMKDNKPAGVLALASDAFFPFRDGIDEAAKIGATAVIEPGGSIKDKEVIAAADEHNIAMVFTGVRHFRH